MAARERLLLTGPDERQRRMNMRVLKKSKKPPEPGDIFAFQVQDEEFMFGRVIDVDTKIGDFDDVIMIYIYKARSASEHEIPALSKKELLIPPVGTNQLGWHQGYFQTVKHRSLENDDVLTIHCFEAPSPIDPSKLRYYDEQGVELPERVEPCGFYGLASYAAIDADISKVLGLPVPPGY
jgi:hypothetical protein